MMADFGTTTGLSWPGKDTELDAQFAQIAGGYDFIETMQIQINKGRTFSREFQTDKEKIIFKRIYSSCLPLKIREGNQPTPPKVVKLSFLKILNQRIVLNKRMYKKGDFLQ